MQAFFNSDGTSVTVIITTIGPDGNHVDPDSWPITDDPAIVLSSHPSASKTVTKIDTGVYKVVWASLSPALDHGDVVFVAIDGAISGVAWSTWQEPIQVVHLPSIQTDQSTELDRLGYLLAALAGACANPQNAAAEYQITLGSDTFTITHSGLSAIGERGTATLAKT